MRRQLGARTVDVVLGVALLAAVLAASASAISPRSASANRVRRLCGAPRPGTAACMAMKLLAASLTPADLEASAVRQGAEELTGAVPAVAIKSPEPGFLTPQLLHAAYSLPSETPAAATQTIAVIDAFDDPSAEADLAVYDRQFGLPACTSANGCFHKLNEQGQPAPLPPLEGEWAGEISIDLQMAHAICQNCHLLLVEAASERFDDLGAAVDTAVSAGATEISNSYGGPERPGKARRDTRLNTRDFNHPGVVLTASSGDCGYLNHACRGLAKRAEIPGRLAGCHRRWRYHPDRAEKALEEHLLGRRRQRL
jgi:hypothetical protein